MRLLPFFALLSACGAEKHPVSDHGDGTRFFNDPPLKISVWKVLKWQFTRHKNPWPDSVDVVPTRPEPSVGAGIRATWVGHATVLVQAPGLNLLTDPVFGRRVGPASWIGPSRLAPAGVAFVDLPPIDAILVSHDHYDHLDMPSLKRLAKEKSKMAIAPLGTADLVKKAGFETVIALDWWQSTTLPSGDTVTLVPAVHHGARWPWDKNKRLWGGFVVSTRAGRVYFAGDTGDGPQFEAIGERFGSIELALIPIGAYLPRWFMAPQHIGPQEAISAARHLRARTSMAIHWGTFRLADDGYREAPDSLLASLARDTAAPDIRVVEIGQSLQVGSVLTGP